MKSKRRRTKQNKTKQNKTKYGGGIPEKRKIADAIAKSLTTMKIQLGTDPEITMYEQYANVEFACSSINIMHNSMYIIKLGKCRGLTGTQILMCIINIAKILNLNKIDLIDTSIVNKDTECEYSLAYYSILLNGISWYNSHNFVSTRHVENINHNNNIRTQRLEDFYSDYKRHYSEVVQIIKTNGYESSNLTVRDAVYYLSRIMNETNATCANGPRSNKIVKAIQHIVKTSEDKLTYNPSLSMIF